MSGNDHPCLRETFAPLHFFKRSGGCVSDAEGQWGMEMLLPLQRCLDGKKGDCSQTTPSQDGAPTSPPSEGKLGWAAGSDRPPVHTKAGWWPSVCNWSQLYLSLQLWESLASRFPKVGELAVGSLFLCFTLRLSVRQVPSLRVLQRHPSPSCPLRGEAAHTRLGAMYLDWSICFILVWEKKNYANWGRHVLCFPAEPAASPVASMLWRSTRGRGRLQVLNFVMLLCCQVLKKKWFHIV